MVPANKTSTLYASLSLDPRGPRQRRGKRGAQKTLASLSGHPGAPQGRSSWKRQQRYNDEDQIMTREGVIKIVGSG